MSPVRAQPVIDPRWQKIEEAVCGAVELPPSERSAWLDKFCEGDAELRSEIDSLLNAQSDAQDFLEQSIAPYAGTLLQEEVATPVPVKVGQYRILREIGRGGMGVVYLAEREDQFKQHVAIKIVKRGLDTDEILQRFRNERQILASLNHPNIAKLFDGGMTQDGLPYFVMEYIDGEPLTKYCDGQNLSIERRLHLFQRACSSVQHAHQNLVVHRDLKPSNILVTSREEVKLLDFGVAKLLTADAGDDATMTQAARQVMTPQYASPEQIRGQRVTTATDVYSLGVVLYELLTGVKPYKVKDTSPEELSRAICETEPTKPSEARSVDFSLRSHARSQTKVYATLRGDLDNIVLMALRKEPERRYKSVEQFSEDIRRYLHGLPVIARKDTASYRASKFIQRHNFGVSAAALIALAIIVGLIGVVWQARVAARERDQARLEKIKAEQTRDFLERMLSYSNPVLNKDSRATTISDILNEVGRRLDQGEFADQPQVRSDLQASIAKIYVRQGLFEAANKHLLEAIALHTRVYGESHPNTVALKPYQALLLFVRGELAESERISRQALPLIRAERLKGNIKADDLAYALNCFAYLRRTQGDSKEAESLFREALGLSPLLSLDEWRSENGTTRSTLASTLADQGRFDEALQTAREAVEEDRRRGEVDTPNFGFALTIYGGFLSEQGDYAEADAHLQQAESIFRNSLPPTSLWIGDNLRNQASSLYGQSRFDQALKKAEETLVIYGKFGPHYDNYPTTLIIKGLSLTHLGNATEGEKILRDALKVRIESLPKEHYWVALAKSALGECLLIQTRYDEAEPLLRESYESLKTSQGTNNPRTLLAQRRLASLPRM